MNRNFWVVIGVTIFAMLLLIAVAGSTLFIYSEQQEREQTQGETR